MASPGVLRLLTELSDGSIEEFTPIIDDEGRVNYPDVERHLDERDGAPFDVLESLTRRGVLYREFQDKAYVCPDCNVEGMNYTSVCQSCGSPNTVEIDLLEHVECGAVAPEMDFQTEDGEYVCPDCGLSLHPEHTELLTQYVCQTCDEHVDEPGHGLRCRECSTICEPTDALEWVLYSYGFDRGGERWVETQHAARQAMVEMLRDRGFAVDVDTTVTDENGTVYPIHIYGEDDLLGDRVVADVHEHPNIDAIETIRAAARAVGSRSVIVTTSGTLSERAADTARNGDVGVLSLQQDGTLRREFDTVNTVEGRSVFERLTSSVKKQFNGT